jgi:hypothetical protein
MPTFSGNVKAPNFQIFWIVENPHAHIFWERESTELPDFLDKLKHHTPTFSDDVKIPLFQIFCGCDRHRMPTFL